MLPFVGAQVHWSWTYSDQCIVFGMALNGRGYIGLAFGYYAELLGPGGKLVFKEPTRGIAYTVGVSDNNDVVIGTEGDWIQYFTPNGSLKWEYKAAGAIVSVDISKDGKTVVAGDSSGYVYLFRNGKLVWRKKLGGYVWSVDLFKDRIAVGVDYNVTALDLSGNVIFSRKYGGYTRKVIGSDRGIYVLVAAKNGSWSEVKRIGWDGKEFWSRHFNNLIRSIDSDGKNVAVAGDIGYLVLLSSNGSIIYKVPFLVSTLQVSTAGGYLLAGGAREAIFIAPNGSVLWNERFNWSVRNVAISRDASFLVVGYGYHSIANCQEAINALMLRGTVTTTRAPTKPSFHIPGLPLLIVLTAGLVIVGFLLLKELRE